MNFSFLLLLIIYGAVVQLGERLTGSQKVTSSTLVGSIKLKIAVRGHPDLSGTLVGSIFFEK